MGLLFCQCHNIYLYNAVWRKILTEENIDEFDKFLTIHQYFPIKIFHLVSYNTHQLQLKCDTRVLRVC